MIKTLIKIVSAKTEAVKIWWYAVFLLTAEQRQWRHDVTNSRSNCRDPWFIATTFKVKWRRMAQCFYWDAIYIKFQWFTTVELRWLEHWWLVYHGCFELIPKSLGKNPLAADMGLFSVIFFFFILKMVYCVFSLESPQWGDSNENTQHTFML